MPKRSKTAINIDKINRQIDKISETFGADSVEISNYITQNKLEGLSMFRTSKGNIHIRNTKPNRQFYQRIAAIAKKPVKQFIAKSKAKYRPPRVRKSPIPKIKPATPLPVQDPPLPAEPWKIYATFAEILDYIYNTSPYRELSPGQQSDLCSAAYRQKPTIENVPPTVKKCYEDLYEDFFNPDITDDFEAVDDFTNPDFFG